MVLPKTFCDAVSSGDVAMVHILMKDSLLVDPSFEHFREMEKAAASMKGLYEEHDGRSLNMNKDTWDNEYMNKMMVQVISNFSHERVEHLKEVVRYLRPITEVEQPMQKKPKGEGDTLKSSAKGSEYQEQKYRDQKAGDYRGAKYCIGALAGAVAGGAIAATANLAVVGGVAVGAAAGVGVVYVGTNLIGEEQ